MRYSFGAVSYTLKFGLNYNTDIFFVLYLITGNLEAVTG